MAKKKQLTLEEKLEEAIVKDGPYDVPGNWVWSKLKVFCNFIDYRGKTPSKTDAGIRLITAKNIKRGYISLKPEEFIAESDYDTWMTRGIPKYGDVIFTTEAPLGNVAQLFLTEKYALAQRAITLSIINGMIQGYLKFVLLSPSIQESINQMATGTTVKGIKASRLKELPLPVPPLKEQQRIVDIIESLFEKLDKAKELIEEAREGFEKRKSAVLEKAFRGELTEKWREINEIDFHESWLNKQFDEIAKVKSNLVEPSDFLNYPHIAPDNIEKKAGKLLEYRTIEEDGVKSAKHRFYPGQILYSKIRPYLSKVVLIEFEGLCSADMYPIETELYAKYLYYYMLSDTFVEYASNAGSRSVLPKINQKELGKIIVPICSIGEQKEIVRILDKLLEEESKIEELTQLEDQIELIEKSILAKAFRGELGTNSEEDESALELLKGILSKDI